MALSTATTINNFNPRSPHGERRFAQAELSRANQHFNPRSPHGERPAALRPHSLPPPISIHAPRTGSDAAARRRLRFKAYFNPRSPHGERRLLQTGFCQM